MDTVERFYNFNESDYFYIERNREKWQMVIVSDIHYTKIVTAVPFSFVVAAYIQNKNFIPNYVSKEQKANLVIDTLIEHEISFEVLEQEYLKRVKVEENGNK